MGITFTRKGYIQVLRDGVVLSEHVEERKAVQSLSEREDGDYVLRYPDVAVSVILRKSDTTPPAVPSGFSASAATATQVTLTLTANVESDFSNYVLERSSDNIGWGYLKSFSGTSTTDTVDVSGSTYYYRAFSIDTRGNRSAYTAVKSAGPYTVNLAWNGTVPNVIFTRGNAQNFDLSPYIIGSSPTITVETGTLPAGVTLNSAQQRLQYDGTSATSTSIVATGVSLRLSTSAEADWQSRISGSSVVWYHDFRNAAEVSQFAWSSSFGSGNDPNMAASGSEYGANVLRQVADGPTGYCLEAFHPAGLEPRTTWWRPFSPMSSGNGRGSADPGGGLTLRTWSPTSGGNQTAAWGFGRYGHPSYGTFDGHDFYCQVRVKMDPRRITGGNDTYSVGKQVWFTLCSNSLTSQEHVFYSYGPGGNQGSGKNYLRCYTNAGGLGGSSPLDQYNSDGRIQHGSTEASDFYYSGGWDCILYHIRVGQEGVASGANSMKLEVWAATEAQLLAGQGYTLTTKKIWNQEYPMNDFEGTNPSSYALQALILSSYNNGDNFPQDFYHRYTQVIFSKAFIPCATV